MKENMKGKMEKVGNLWRWRRTMKEKNKSVDSRMEGFGLRMERVRDTQEKPVNMWYSNMAFSNVKHKKQSCRTCRMSVTQTFVSLYGFSVMYPPLGKERFWTLSFVTVFFLFLLLCFYFFNSWFWLYSIWCTLYIYGDALCTVHCTIFCVMSGLSPLGQPHFLTKSPPLTTHKNTHRISALRLSKFISQLQTLLLWNIGYELSVEESILVGHGAPLTALQIVFTEWLTQAAFPCKLIFFRLALVFRWLSFHINTWNPLFVPMSPPLSELCSLCT